jgi:hypothetical protein
MKLTLIRAVFALALVGGLVAVGLSATQEASAKNDKQDAKVSFTKWVTTFPSMAGTVGGDAGSGPFVGEVLAYNPAAGGGRLTQIVALYTFQGGRHAFTAQVQVTIDNKDGKAVVIGMVKSGWLEGALVYGSFKTVTCNENPAPDHTCFRGNLRIMGGALD